MDNPGIDLRQSFAVPCALLSQKTGPPRRIAGKIFDNLSQEALSIQQSAKADEKAVLLR